MANQIKLCTFNTICLLSAISLAADAPNAGDLEIARLATIQAKREKLFFEFQYLDGRLKAIPIDDEKLKAEEAALKAKLEALKR